MPVIPAFTLIATNHPVSFRFTASSRFGWAICTVNNDTGELAVQSDWGTWAYRWHVESLTKPLVDFLATAEVNYVANKLAHDESHVFDASLTVAALRKKLCHERLQEGTALTKLAARTLWNKLGDLKSCGSYDEIYEAFGNIDFSELITDEPWNYVATAPSYVWNMLTQSLIPALAQACREYSARLRESALQGAQ